VKRTVVCTACISALFVCGMLAGCRKPSAATVASAAPSASEAPAAAPLAAPASTGLPTSEDFEAAAGNEINPSNMEAELEKLEKEISK
jgi:hypothetical protein